jgi:hypothetical protein
MGSNTAPSESVAGRLIGACSFVLAADFRASFGFYFRFAPRRELLFTPSKEGAERREAQRVRALARSTGPILPDRPRLTALHCGVFNPWGPACLARGFRRLSPPGPGKAQGTSPGRHNAPGGCPRTPGTTTSDSRGRRRRSPSASGSPAQTPLSAKGDESDLCERRIAIHIKIFSKGGSQAPDCRN